MTPPRDVLRRAVRAAAAHPAEAILRAVLDGLASGRPLPDALDPGWTQEQGPLLDKVREAAAGAEVAAFGMAYESLLALDPARRGRQGSHYTPPELAAEVVAGTFAELDVSAQPSLRAWSGGVQALSVCDPAMGGGVFLLAAAECLRANELAGRLFGVDKDPLAVAVARLSLWLATGDETVAERLICGDALLGPVRDGEFPGVGDAVAWHELDGFGDGFDAVVGNPPFLGGSFISGRLGAAYRAELVARVAGGQRGNADLTAYFLLRAHDLLREGGVAGLVVTNTVAEGDTRRVGLERLIQRGAVILRAERDRPWPGEASLHYTLLWLRKGAAVDAPARIAGPPPPRIDAMLRCGGRPEPLRLQANRGLAFNGSKIYGQGFLLTPQETFELLKAEPRSSDVLRPYLSGDDLYGREDRAPSRYVICFRDWPLEQAEEYPHCLEIIRRRVQSERAILAGRNSIGDRRATHWWQFGSYAPALYRAIGQRERVLAKVLHSHTHAFCPVETFAIFSHALAVWVETDPALLASLQSSPHRAWALRYGSTLGIAPRYTLSRTFETFPLPPRTGLLRSLGEGLEAHRLAVQQARGEGLTRLYQRVADPDEMAADIRQWRVLEETLDAAVLAAYGWDDLDPTHGWRCEPVPSRGPHHEVLETVIERLWELNLATAAATG